MPRVNLARRLASLLLYLGYLAAAVLLIVYLVFWWPFKSDLRERLGKAPALSFPEVLDVETARHLGWVEQGKQRSHFVHFDERKPTGVTRLCAFGDSFTAGDEVAPEHDFPTLLEDMLRERGTPNIEVLNFGAGWYGFHQAYLSWQRLAPRYSCDLALLGPSGFHHRRDTRFNHTDLRFPTAIHSRFVLDGGDVRLIETYGNTDDERFNNYVRFLPRWRYLRYERDPAMLLRALVPKERTLSNAFYYYDGDGRSEAHATYLILLDRMRDSDMPVLMLHHRKRIEKLVRPLAREGFVVGGIDLSLEFPFQAPRNHPSAWGNRLVAEHFYAELVPDAPRRFPALEMRDPGDVLPATDRGSMRPLLSYSEVDVEMAGQSVAQIRGMHRVEALTDIWDVKAVSLLAFRTPGASLLDAVFVSLDLPLEAGISISVQEGNGEITEVGVVQLVQGASELGVVESDVFVTHGRDHVLSLRKNALRSGPLPSLRVYLGERPLLASLPGTRRGLRSLAAGFMLARVPEGSYVPIEDLPESGLVYLRLRHPEHGTRRIPLARFQKTWREVGSPAGSLRMSQLRR